MHAMPAMAAPFVVGSWYGQGQPNDKSNMWLDHLLADGSFNGQYRTCVKGKASDTFQAGTWSLTGDTLTISILTVDGFFQPRNDVYQNLSHDARRWAYKYLKLGYVSKAERVDDKLQLSSCETVS